MFVPRQDFHKVVQCLKALGGNVNHFRLLIIEDLVLALAIKAREYMGSIGQSIGRVLIHSFQLLTNFNTEKNNITLFGSILVWKIISFSLVLKLLKCVKLAIIYFRSTALARRDQSPKMRHGNLTLRLSSGHWLRLP